MASAGARALTQGGVLVPVPTPSQPTTGRAGCVSDYDNKGGAASKGSGLALFGSKRGSAEAALPPECSQPAPWKGADKRFAKFMKKAGGALTGRSGGDASGAHSSRPTLEMKRKPLHPTLWLKVPRAVASTTLVLREGAALDSTVIGNLLPGSEIFVMEKVRGPDGSLRALVADTPMIAKPPLGWVTAMKDGVELLDDVEYDSAMPTIDGATGFFTSQSRPAAAPLLSPHGSDAAGSPRGSPRSLRDGAAHAKLSERAEAENDDAPKASGRKSSPTPRGRAARVREAVQQGGAWGGGSEVML